VDESKVNQANLDFYRQHRAEIDRLLHIGRPAAASSR
jgi:hypothetical protein